MELKIYNPTMDNALKHIDWNFEELKKEGFNAEQAKREAEKLQITRQYNLFIL